MRNVDLLAELVALAIEAGADPAKASAVMVRALPIYEIENRIAYEAGFNDGLTVRQSHAPGKLSN